MSPAVPVEQVMKCPHCDVSFVTAPERQNWCAIIAGMRPRQPQQCPVCGSPYIGGFRAGTQQIEEMVKKAVSTGKGSADGSGYNQKKEGHAKILAAFAETRRQIS